MRTLTKNGKSILANAKLRKQVAALSTGEYYKQFHHWVAALDDVLVQAELRLGFEITTPHNADGRGTQVIESADGTIVGYMWWSYHRMESSGNWEIICYIS
jgi:hypothetical protein